MKITKHNITNFIKQVLTEEEQKNSTLLLFKNFLVKVATSIKKIEKVELDEYEYHSVYNILAKDGGELAFSFVNGRFSEVGILYSLKKKYNTPMSESIMIYFDKYQLSLSKIDKFIRHKNKQYDKHRNEEESIFKTFINMINSK